jgi:hypothetical protein
MSFAEEAGVEVLVAKGMVAAASRSHRHCCSTMSSVHPTTVRVITATSSRETTGEAAAAAAGGKLVVDEGEGEGEEEEEGCVL